MHGSETILTELISPAYGVNQGSVYVMNSVNVVKGFKDEKCGGTRQCLCSHDTLQFKIGPQKCYNSGNLSPILL